MADTLLQVAQRVARRLRVDATFTTFSDNDESNNIVSYINDAYQDLLINLQDDAALLLDTTKSITLVPGTRVYSLDTTAHHLSLMDWSFANASNNNDPVEYRTLEWIQAVYPSYQTDSTGNPQYVYQEGNEQVGFYPVPSTAATISYKFSKPFSRLVNPSDTFLVPDRWLVPIEAAARAMYAADKSFVDAEELAAIAEQKMVELYIEIEMKTPHSFGG